MTDSAMDSLLGAVRRRMWRSEFVAAARLALWAATALLLLAAVAHVAFPPLPAGVVIAAVAALFALAIARAGWRRPSDSACALWADRNLDGASAFSTWLETRAATTPVAQAPAAAWLERWTTARVPHSLRMLERRRDPAYVVRPLLSALVSGTFAALVLTLPALSPWSRPAPPNGSTLAERPAPPAPSSGASELVGELAQAARAADPRRATERRDGRGTPSPGPGKIGDGTEVASARSDARPTGERPTVAKSAVGAPADAAASSAARGAGAAAGRAAGDSADNRADAGSAPPPQVTMPAARGEPVARRPSEQRADMTQMATFDDDVPMPATKGRADRAPAATPPPATDARELTPSQAAYVQAWMKANGQRR